MRTTLVIDDELYRQVKAKAALEGRRVTDLVEEGMKAVLGISVPPEKRRRENRLKLPLIPARPGGRRLFVGMTQEEIHQRLSELEMRAERSRVEPPD